jgi:hypothetical protein
LDKPREFLKIKIPKRENQGQKKKELGSSLEEKKRTKKIIIFYFV